MGLKDNFSQAVKELWKKDGQEGEPAQSGGKEPSELDKYLRGQNEQGQQGQQGQQVGGREMGSGGVPLETPYFPNNAGEPARPQQPAQPTNTAGAAPEPPVDRPSANAAMNAPGPADNAQAQQPVDNGYNRNIAGNFGQNGGGYNGNNNAGSGYGGNNNFSDGYGGNSNAGGGYGGNNNGYNGNNNGFNGNPNAGRFAPPPSGNGGAPAPMGNMGGESEETTIISKNTQIEGNIRSLANMTVDGNIKGNLETTRNVDMSGKVIGDIIANNAALNSAAMQGNISLKGRMKMDRDTILIGDLSSQYADINGRIRGKLDIVGKAELKRDAIVFGDINASTIAVTDGAIIQGYVNTTFLSKDDSRNVFPDAISIEEQKQSAGANPAGNRNNGNMGGADNSANPTNPNT